VPYLSALEVFHDEALYKYTFTFTFTLPRINVLFNAFNVKVSVVGYLPKIRTTVF